jgi:hypothetical protein
MRADSPTVKSLLARIGFTTTEQLFNLSQTDVEAMLGHDEARIAAHGGAMNAAKQLALRAWGALNEIETNERLADQHLRELAHQVAAQQTAAADGLARTDAWITQAATNYAQRVATITAKVAEFHAAALPLAVLLDLEPTA